MDIAVKKKIIGLIPTRLNSTRLPQKALLEIKNIPLVVHTIAGPLAGMSIINSLCSYNPPSLINNNVKFYEWRTIKELDGEFKDIDFDPQVIDLPGSNVRRLPETYNGRRLGHNWSISWVADEISKLH